MTATKPKPLGIDAKTNPSLLIAGRYGTDDMIDIWGQERTYEFSLRAQSESVRLLSDLRPDIVPPDEAAELMSKANLEHVRPQRIREIEEATNHDVIAINTAWEEQVSPRAASHINKFRASSDTTETAKALQLKRSLEVVADSAENLRDIILEKSMEWIDMPHVDKTHLFDALPTVAGRPFSFYAEMLQSGLEVLNFFYNYSLVGKWGDATGNHHSADSAEIDGIALQEKYCRRLGLRNMTADAQVPGREFIADVVYATNRILKTAANLAKYIRSGRDQDVDIFSFPRGAKGSSSMPHKDMKGGNPIREENVESMDHVLSGILTATNETCKFDYARDLSGSASDRIGLETAFKCGDYAIRRLAEVAYKLMVNEERCRERVERTHGITTAENLMNYLTDSRRHAPMGRREAHDLSSRLATLAYDTKTSFTDVLLADETVRSLLTEYEIRRLSDAFAYIGQSKEIVNKNFKDYHRKRTL